MLYYSKQFKKEQINQTVQQDQKRVQTKANKPSHFFHGFGLSQFVPVKLE